jgi:DNA-binding response OmpR family regulator
MNKGMSLGADLYITKPFSTRELVAKIDGLLGAGP